MYPNAAPAGRPPYNPKRVHSPHLIPPYDWKPSPSTQPLSPPPPALHASALVNRRKGSASVPLSPTMAVLLKPAALPLYPTLAPGKPSLPGPSAPLSVPSPLPHGCHLCGERDLLSGQMVDLFEACQQQSADLEWKELCRARLQREIQRLFPLARLYLAGSSLNGFGSRNSDADLCLVIQAAPVTYMERPQLIRAKVPILKFRDKVSGVEFDLNVNNTVGIRNTFLLRSYADAERRVRPIILDSFRPSMDIHLVPEGPRDIPPYSSSNQASLGELLLGFLKYYASVFRYEPSNNPQTRTTAMSS
ncbi:unnamed protein product, partial [Coregonus sp. 'balchen']